MTPKPSESESSSSESQAIVLAHAERVWKAEEVNASRLASKVSLVTAGITATLGFKLFVSGSAIPLILKLGWFHKLAILGLGAFAGLCLIRSIWMALGVKITRRHFLPWLKELWSWIPLTQTRINPPEQTYSACELLTFTEQERDAVHEADASDTLKLVIARVELATSELRFRNSVRKSRIESSERWFLTGLFALLISAGWYVVQVLRVGAGGSDG